MIRRSRRPHHIVQQLDEWSARIRQGDVDRWAELALPPSGAGDIPWRSRLLEYYASRTLSRGREPNLSPCTLSFPRVFSFIDEPELALELLGEFVLYARDGAREIRFDQGNCDSLDLCAAMVLNALAGEAKQRLKTLYSGEYPASKEAHEIVAATGIPRLLRLAGPEPDEFLVFRPRHGGVRRRSSLFRPSVKERVSSDLAAYLDECLGRYGYEFTLEGKRYIGQLAGEVLGNAEDHAPEWPWYVAAYLRQPPGKQFGDCHITLLNFGSTLAETLQSLPHGSPLRLRIEGLVELHQREKYFGLLRPRWTEEGLWTLYALQEFVTRHYGELNPFGRGVGTTDMIEAFQTLGRTAETGYEPRMCLISGHTQVIFDGHPHHRMREKSIDGGRPVRQITFNQSNDLREAPDEGTVQHLRNFFPGTIISLRFFLDERYLEELHNSHAPQNDRSA